MGRSLRRIKKSRPRIVKRKHKKPFVRSTKPTEINVSKRAMEEKLQKELDWDERQKIDDNYERLGIVMDPNMAFGRNANKRDPLEETMSNRDRLDHEDEIDDELKAAMSKQRSSGKALPKRPTSRQRQIIRRLTDAHGDDLDSMVLDRKLNAMQLSRGQVKNLIEACNYWEEGSSVGFRAKIKGL